MARGTHKGNLWRTPLSGPRRNTATPLIANTELYAHWAIQSILISFDSTGGSAVAPVTVDYGSTLTLPVAPKRDAFTFAGWATDAKGAVAWIPTTAITAARTLYATWESVAVTPTTPPTTPPTTGPAVSADPAIPAESTLASTGWNGTLSALLAFSLLVAGGAGYAFSRRRRAV